MSTIDIRNDTQATPTRIRFADDDGHYGWACFVTKTPDGVVFEDMDKDGENYTIKTGDVLTLRKALNKAEELGWIPKC